MAEVIFSHPLMRDKRGQPHDLHVSVKPDQVTWSYGLNTAVYPTYGGEVVQILSVYFGDMTIAGTVATVAELEKIYGWFITYMQYATQGRDPAGPSYSQQPVAFYYPERQWHFHIWPKTLPGFKYGRDVVAPTWTLTAAVKEPDATFAEQIKDYAAFQASTGKALAAEGGTFGKATADFGTTGDLVNNPFASIDADPSRKGQSVSQFLQQEASQLGDTYTGFVQAWQTGDLSKLPQFSAASKPPSTTPSTSQPSATKNVPRNVTAVGPTGRHFS